MMLRMHDHVTVWAVDLGVGVSMKERKGVLRIEDGALRFAPWKEEQAEVVIPLREIAKVKRLRGSPVLLVERTVGQDVARIAFYFVQPPPMPPSRGEPRTEPLEQRSFGLGLLRNPARRARKQNAGYLGMMNKTKKAEVVEWADAVQEAIQAVRGAGGGA
jgi:hypothetical protein